MSLRDSSAARRSDEPIDGLDDGLFASLDEPAKVTWSLPEQIANKLVEGIIRGAYAPGQRLQEAAIAATFGVSRGPVREALRIVEKEGLADIRPRHGAFVARLSARNVAEIFEVRVLLMGLAARRIAEMHTDEILAFLRDGTSALRETLASAERFLPLVYRYSMYVVGKIENDLARGILVSLARQTLHLTRVALLEEGNRRLWTENWDAVVSAVGLGEPEAAEACMRRLVENVSDAVLRTLATRRDDDAGPGGDG